MTSSDATATVTSTTSGTSISCQDSDYWAPTVSNWAEEGVDAKLSSWVLNLVKNPPTAIPKGSYPTELPQIFTGFGDTSKYENVIGIPGQLMAIANSGMEASCALVDGPNDQWYVFSEFTFPLLDYVSVLRHVLGVHTPQMCFKAR